MHQSCTIHRQQNIARVLGLCRSLCSIHTVVQIIMMNHIIQGREQHNNSCLEFLIPHQVRGRLLLLHKLHQNCFQGMASSWSQPARLTNDSNLHHIARCKVFSSSKFQTMIYDVCSKYKNYEFNWPWQSYMSCRHLQVGLVPAKKKMPVWIIKDIKEKDQEMHHLSQM